MTSRWQPAQAPQQPRQPAQDPGEGEALAREAERLLAGCCGLCGYWHPVPMYQQGFSRGEYAEDNPGTCTRAGGGNLPARAGAPPCSDHFRPSNWKRILRVLRQPIGNVKP